MTKVKCICKQCGKHFEVKPSYKKNGRGIFCSRECADKWRSKNVRGENHPNWQGGKIKKICEFCGKVFFVKSSRKDIARFCSLQCHGKYLRGVYNPNWRGGRIKTTCRQCGKEIKVPRYAVKEDGNFCSYECMGRWYSENRSGENSKRWQKKIEKKCQYCGKIIYAYQRWIDKGYERFFCSRECYWKWESEDEETCRHLREIGGYHRILRPTGIEKIFQQICEKNNLPFRYVGNGQLWIGKDKRLNPDFCEINGKKICIEIFGDYWHSPLLNYKVSDTHYKDRIMHYKKYGWITVIIWGTDLLRKDAEQFVLGLLRKEGVID